jgi:16S rRNA (uracil1498-N3)-methyltransferase
MQRFFLTSSCINEDHVYFPEHVAYQLSHVLRMQPGQYCIVLDNQGNELKVELLTVLPGKVTGKVTGCSPASGEPRVQLMLFLCLTQRDKFEVMLQKCTEVGASSFIPVISSRSLVQNMEEVEKKHERWTKIIREAAEQSGRGKLPDLLPALAFVAACEEASRHNELALIPWEEERHSKNRCMLSEIIAQKCYRDGQPLEPLRVALMIGPEGGFSEGEVNLAKNHGMVPISLGPRVLRVETAAVVASALVLYTLGEMG